MILGYNTNGLAECGASAAVEALAAIGFQGIALTLDHELLNPYAASFEAELERTAAALRRHGFRSVIETGARFLLDPGVKHEPTLVSPDSADRARRIDFLFRAIDVSAALEADCVSLWSGCVRDGATDRTSMDRMADGIDEVLDYAGQRDVVIGFEPEPCMFVDTLARYGDLLDEMAARRVDDSRLLLTIDIGHLHCQGETPIAQQLRRWRERLVNVHIEDMRAGVHEHLMFGDGEIDFPPVIATLAEIGYAGLINVELTRHRHLGIAAARRAYDYLAPQLDKSAVDA